MEQEAPEEPAEGETGMVVDEASLRRQRGAESEGGSSCAEGWSSGGGKKKKKKKRRPDAASVSPAPPVALSPAELPFSGLPPSGQLPLENSFSVLVAEAARMAREVEEQKEVTFSGLLGSSPSPAEPALLEGFGCELAAVGADSPVSSEHDYVGPRSPNETPFL